VAVDTRLSNLPMPPEPLDAQQRFELDLQKNPWLAKCTVRDGAWLAGDLWRLWQPWLEREGFSPERVQESVSDCSPYFMQWIQHEIAWEHAVSSVVRNIGAHQLR